MLYPRKKKNRVLNGVIKQKSDQNLTARNLTVRLRAESDSLTSGIAIINAKFHIRQHRNHQCSKPPSFKIRQRRYQPNLWLWRLWFWRLWILAGTALAVLKFGVCGCRPTSACLTPRGRSARLVDEWQKHKRWNMQFSNYSALPLIQTCVSPDSAVIRTLDPALT